MDPFQTQYPLSPRKFWKKVIPKFFAVLLIPIFFVGFIFIAIVATGPEKIDPSLVTGPLLGWIVATFILMLLYALYVRAYIKSYYYDGGENFVTIRKGVFTPAEIHIQYQKIQDVYVDQDLFDRMMGLYDVHIASATVSSGIEAHIDGVEAQAAQGLKNFLLQRISAGSNQRAASADGSTIPTSNIGTTSLKINLAEEVSTNTYPISGRWVLSKIITSFFGGIGFMIFAPVALWVLGIQFSSTSSSGNLDLSWLLPYVPPFAVLYAIMLFISNLLWKNFFFFQFLPEYIVAKTGILQRQEKHVPYTTIQDVTLKQGIADRLFGIYNVMIENATQGGAAQPVNVWSVLLTRGRSQTPFNGVLIPGQTQDKAQKLTDVLKSEVLSRVTQRGTGL